MKPRAILLTAHNPHLHSKNPSKQSARSGLGRNTFYRNFLLLLLSLEMHEQVILAWTFQHPFLCVKKMRYRLAVQ